MANKPIIRFKGFTDDWEQRKLGDVSNVFDGVHQTPEYKLSGVMFLSVENIGTLESDKYISEEAFIRDFKNFPVKNDILMTRIGDVGTPKVVESNKKIAYYVSLALLKPISIDSFFLCNLIKSPHFQNNLKKRTLLTAIPQKINKDEIGKVNIIISLKTNEQLKIGEYFHSVDNLITLHQRNVDNYKQLKQALLQKMFSAEGKTKPIIRFKGFTDDWEQRKLGEMAVFRRGLTYRPLDVCDNGIRVLRSSNINEHTFLLKDDDVFVQPEAINIGFVKENDILITAANGSSRLVGKHALIKGMPDNTAVHGGFMLLATARTPYFTNALMSSPWYASFINTYVAGGNGAIGNLSKSDLEEQDVYVPKQVEQESIGVFFFGLDNLITLHQRNVDNLQQLKKALLQKMFI